MRRAKHSYKIKLLIFHQKSTKIEQMYFIGINNINIDSINFVLPVKTEFDY